MLMHWCGSDQRVAVYLAVTVDFSCLLLSVSISSNKWFRERETERERAEKYEWDKIYFYFIVRSHTLCNLGTGCIKTI